MEAQILNFLKYNFTKNLVSNRLLTYLYIDALQNSWNQELF